MTTPNYGWPYPTPASTVDIPRDIQALAQAVDITAKTYFSGHLVQVRQTIAQSIPNAAYTALTWNIEDADPLDMHTGSGTRMTVKVAGLYRLAGVISLAQNATGFRRGAWYINDVIMAHSVAATTGGTQGLALVMGSPFAQLAVNDWVELRAFQDSGAALSSVIGAGNQSWASMEWASP